MARADGIRTREKRHRPKDFDIVLLLMGDVLL
jgi:hypothetical protein